ncbi:MAG: zinc-binding dehydrogenase [Clostridia bacterium]|nr:zinc-binding dehydrogenase [Clostridia bacterium]
MKLYRANGNEKFIVEETTSVSEKDIVKIKISKIFPTRSDLDIFCGKSDISYPFVPCHIAVGYVSEDKPEYGLKRGTKVVLNPYIVTCSDRAQTLPEIKTYGVDMNGFLADFVCLPVENIIALPEDVREDDAIFAEHIAISLAVINNFEISKGDYIAVIGGSPLCNIIAQLAMYFQAIPIVIDYRAERLAKAKECGVYYTINSGKEVTIDRVLEITGGRMAEHTILHSEQGLTPHYLFSLAREGGDCTIVSVNSYTNPLDTDINLINRKQLTVKGISNGASEFNSAIYILAQKVLKLSPLIENVTPISDAEKLFIKLKEQGFGMANVLEMD